MIFLNVILSGMYLCYKFVKKLKSSLKKKCYISISNICLK